MKKLVDTKNEFISITLPSTGRIRLNQPLEGFDLKRLQEEIQAFYGDRLQIVDFGTSFPKEKNGNTNTVPASTRRSKSSRSRRRSPSSPT